MTMTMRSHMPSTSGLLLATCERTGVNAGGLVPAR